MMKSKQYSRNLAKYGLLLLNLTLLSFFIFGCTSSTRPTYHREDIAKAIQDISKDEYRIDVKAKLIGQTLWIYMPVEDMLEKPDKPEKYLERFEIRDNKIEFKDGEFKLEYLIKAVPEQEKTQEVKYNKTVSEKINNVWSVLRRVIFSMERSEKNEPSFFCLVISDIKNGFEISETFYYLDLKKFSYGFISSDEYQHRIIYVTNISPEIIDDKEGLHLKYKDITLEDFIVAQIQHRIKLKFQKPEVDKNADIDKEVLKIIEYTLKTYDFKNFSAIELYNLVTKNRAFLNKAAVLADFNQ